MWKPTQTGTTNPTPTPEPRPSRDTGAPVYENNAPAVPLAAASGEQATIGKGLIDQRRN